MRQPRTARKFRVLVYCLFLGSAFNFSGCATDQRTEYERKQWEEMNWAQKTASYCGWLFLDLLYAYAGGQASVQDSTR
jgi:hypothetical protein